jgi:metal-responsive CopG/Arc/MetJ family transcriptional regulator
MAGKQITLTLPEYTFNQLDEMSKNTRLKKSAIMTLALEKYVREKTKEEIEEYKYGTKGEIPN